jgi:hypothetical protein
MFLCYLEDLPKYGTHSFTASQQEVFVVRQATQIWAYVSHYPHMGVGVILNWMPDQFLDLEGRYIQYATHGALFRFGALPAPAQGNV